MPHKSFLNTTPATTQPSGTAQMASCLRRSATATPDSLGDWNRRSPTREMNIVGRRIPSVLEEHERSGKRGGPQSAGH